MHKYDYLIVGTGLYGAVFAHEAKKRGKKCLVIDKRNHTGGNIYCENIESIDIHQYGAHIFHTNDKNIWQYVNKFVGFKQYTHSPIVSYKCELYNLPFNMNTFYQLWKVKTPQEASKKLAEQCEEYKNIEPKNFEEKALKLVGKEIYEKLIKGYTEKQWGCDAKMLPSFIIERLPIRLSFDNNYFNDIYQGIPIGGYNILINNLLNEIEIKLKTDFFSDRSELENIADKIVYTGKLDEFYGYIEGALSYRSLKFEQELLEVNNYQGCAVINYTEKEIPYTRIIEHKHFDLGNSSPKTIITKEYPQNWDKTKEAYYPVVDDQNIFLFEKYRTRANNEKKYIFGGRLAEFKYYNMDDVIKSALDKIRLEFG